MKIIANIDGWTKEIDVDPWTANRGYLFVAIDPPMESCVRKSDLVTHDNITKVKLWYVGNNEFRYIP